MKRLPLVLVASLCTVAAACSSADLPEERPEELASSEDEIRASCSNPRMYFATLREGTCTPIEGRRGRWMPEALFDDAPEEVTASTCAYRWVGEKYSRADRDAIVARVGLHDGLAPACGAASKPAVGDLTRIASLDIWGHAGSVGCDVCGIVKRGKIWVVLPPERLGNKQFQVNLTNGEARFFQINATEARALSIELPPPPAGTQYEAGRVGIY
ncbi:MAG: hypothetical protein KF819_07440 [Labilithrix sp.]|nr:hypothetical protein [Labilithrix sp.]